MKSELAKARDKWLNSEEGKRCCEGTPTGQYLRNRLERAFLAGAKFSSERIKMLKTRIEQLEYQEICKDCSAKTDIGCKAKERIKELEELYSTATKALNSQIETNEKLQTGNTQKMSN